MNIKVVLFDNSEQVFEDATVIHPDSGEDPEISPLALNSTKTDALLVVFPRGRWLSYEEVN